MLGPDLPELLDSPEPQPEQTFFHRDDEIPAREAARWRLAWRMDLRVSSALVA